MLTGGKEGDLVLADVLRLPGQIGFDILEDDSGAANHGFLRSKGDVGGQQGINDVVLPQVYSYLVKRDLEGNIVGDVAESWEVSEDELTWTFHLRKGVKFHSGEELKASDVAFRNAFVKIENGKVTNYFQIRNSPFLHHHALTASSCPPRCPCWSG